MDYLIFLTLAMCVTYFILLYLFPFFFAQKIISPRKDFLFSLVCIISFSVLAYVLNFLIQDAWIANRILHIFGGGFLGFLVCFLAVRDSGVHINKFQFFLFSALIVLALGIANELMELILQECNVMVSATTVDDTWLDLASNVIGVAIASVCLVPFHKWTALDHI
jgi:hypothetical protein